MKVIKIVFILLLAVLIIGFLTKNNHSIDDKIMAIVAAPDFINKEGNTIRERVETPDGFTRKVYPEGTFADYIQNFTLKNHDAKVINYDGSEYIFQQGHCGVLTVDVPDNGLQQCADALIRLYSEYLWETGNKNKIGFEFTSGNYCSWSKYASGYRPKINGNSVRFSKTAKSNSSKENFYRYLNLIYTYSGTLSLYNELPKIQSVKDLEVGDMLVNPGTPGHIIMIADVAENENGEKIFLFIQGNTPAQSIHLIKNFKDSSLNPWYQLQDGKAVNNPIYSFPNPKFVRFKP